MNTQIHPIRKIIEKRKEGAKVGIYSACSANPLVVEAVLETAKETNSYALIEATANQVNQFGGYTGMTPSDFVTFINDSAAKVGISMEQVILGGDHLGPLTWVNLSEEQAMANAEELVRQYVLAGFTKLHIDTSMMLSCDNENEKLSDKVIANRAARLINIAEQTLLEVSAENEQEKELVYVIGSEVPIPGGAHSNDEAISVTSPEQFMSTVSEFKQTFEDKGISDSFSRVIAVVVQPGVEFSDLTVTEYDREKAKSLCLTLDSFPEIVFEGHSTDYQTPQKLKEMVEDGIAILKVGPALTYALRQALFALEDIERTALLNSGKVLSEYREILEYVMLSKPENWKKYYKGDLKEQALKRKFSYSDRCRYYMPEPEVEKSAKLLFKNINENNIPLGIIEQYMPIQYKKIRENKLGLSAECLVKDRIKDYINDYIYAANCINVLK